MPSAMSSSPLHPLAQARAPARRTAAHRSKISGPRTARTWGASGLPGAASRRRCRWARASSSDGSAASCCARRALARMSTRHGAVESLCVVDPTEEAAPSLLADSPEQHQRAHPRRDRRRQGGAADDDASALESARAPSYAINCAASRHRSSRASCSAMKGPLHGATHARTGLLEAAAAHPSSSTRSASLPAAAQAKLLRAIENAARCCASRPPCGRWPSTYAPGGDHRQSGTLEIAQSALREPLLSTRRGHAEIPPLRERRDQNRPPGHAVLEGGTCQAARRRGLRLTPEVMKRLVASIGRQRASAQAVIERAVLLAPRQIGPQHLMLSAPPRSTASPRRRPRAAALRSRRRRRTGKEADRSPAHRRRAGQERGQSDARTPSCSAFARDARPQARPLIGFRDRASTPAGPRVRQNSLTERMPRPIRRLLLHAQDETVRGAGQGADRGEEARR